MLFIDYYNFWCVQGHNIKGDSVESIRYVLS